MVFLVLISKVKQKFCRPLLCRKWTRGPQNIYKLTFLGLNEKKKKKKINNHFTSFSEL